MAATTRYTIYSHADADGGIAALLLSCELSRRWGETLDVHIVPVDYGPPTRRPWFATPLRFPCAVLDFALHPQLFMERSYGALPWQGGVDGPPCYWLDHHATGGQLTFVTPETVQAKAPKGLVTVWDTAAISTPGLMRTHRATIGLSDDTLARFETLIDYAEIIDGALYQSAALASDFTLPTVRLAALFACQHPSVSRRGLCRKLVADLSQSPRDNPLQALGRDPVYAALIDYEADAAAQRREAFAMVCRTGSSGRIAVFDFRTAPQAWRGIGRLLPYELAPEAHWAVHVAPPDASGTCAVTCGENPWCRPPQPVPLGALFAQRFGGGGHRYVAGGRIRAEDGTAIGELVDELQGFSLP